MKKKEKYDFYLIGQKHANDGILSLQRLAEQYEKVFGEEAKLQFELGIASVISFYTNMVDDNKIDDLTNVCGTKDYGVPNTRNNSYFGGIGTGKQSVIEDFDGFIAPRYIEPKQRKRSK